jgi:hypothetical protein
MPAKGDGIGKRKDGCYMARYTVHTPDAPKRKTIYSKAYKEVGAAFAIHRPLVVDRRSRPAVVSLSLYALITP